MDDMLDYNLKGRYARAKATWNDKDYEKIWHEKLTFIKRIKRTIASFLDTPSSEKTEKKK